MMVPPNCVLQDEYVDYFFHITQQSHYHVALKDKLATIVIKESRLTINPEFCFNCAGVN
jgi:hypothetical protein